MAITKSAKKALRQNKKRRLHNLRYKTKIKTLMKKGLSFAGDGKLEDLKRLLPSLYKALDKAVKVGILKKNTAARRKSLVARKLSSKK
ncbi:MAG: 30S ribosomal protein S20 [Candidatus Spechtbacterales bacterium]